MAAMTGGSHGEVPGIVARRSPGGARTFGRLAPWATIITCCGYLGYSAGRFRVLGIPIPLLAAAFAAALLVAWFAFAALRRRERVMVMVVAGAASLAGLGVMALWAIGRYFAFRPDRHAGPFHRLVLPLLGPRFFAGSPFLLLGLAAAGLAVGILLARSTDRRPSAIHVLAVLVITMMVLTDIVLIQTPGLRDFRLDLGAATTWLGGGNPYIREPLVGLPADPTQLPFLYPPVLLPMFGWLASLPLAIAALLWLTGSVIAAFAALWLFGLSIRWSMVLLLWPPLAQGLYVGNIAVPSVLLFAIGPWFAGALLLGGIAKIQLAIPALWGFRTKRLRSLALGLAIGLGLVLVALPLTGVGAWVDWIHGLVAFQESQRVLPLLYGLALPALVPYPVYLALALVAIALAFAAAGRDGLARFGIASIVASPSLFPHGFLVGIPALLRLRSFWLWVVLGLTSILAGYGWWISIAIVVASWFVHSMVRGAVPDEPLHPLGAAEEPWPAQAAIAAEFGIRAERPPDREATKAGISRGPNELAGPTR